MEGNGEYQGTEPKRENSLVNCHFSPIDFQLHLDNANGLLGSSMEYKSTSPCTGALQQTSPPHPLPNVEPEVSVKKRTKLDIWEADTVSTSDIVASTSDIELKCSIENLELDSSQPVNTKQLDPSQPVNPTQDPSKPVNPTQDPVQPELDPSKPVNPTQDPVQPELDPSWPVNPTQDPVQPELDPSKLVNPTQDPVQPELDPSKLVNPTQDHVPPELDPSQPVNPTQDHVQPELEPVKPTQDPIQPELDLSQPVNPTRGSVQPDLDLSQPVNPTQGSVQPDLDLSQPVNPTQDPVQPELDPSQPINHTQDSELPVHLPVNPKVCQLDSSQQLSFMQDTQNMNLIQNLAPSINLPLKYPMQYVQDLIRDRMLPREELGIMDQFEDQKHAKLMEHHEDLSFAVAKVSVSSIVLSHSVTDASVGWTGSMNLGSYCVEGKEEGFCLVESDNELEIEKEIDDESIKEATGKVDGGGGCMGDTVESISSSVTTEVILSKIIEHDFDLMEPSLKRQKLDDSELANIHAENLNLSSEEVDDQIIPDNEKLTSDGHDTVFQILPTECAREHALIPNIPPCRSQFLQLHSNDRDNPPDDGKGGAVSGESITNNTQTILEPATECKYSTVPLSDYDDNQLVPEEDWKQSCANQSLYADNDVKPSVDLKGVDQAPKVVKSILHSEQPGSFIDQVTPQRGQCFFGGPTHHDPQVPVKSGLVNFNKPRLRLGLSKKQKCRSLHDK